MNNQSRICKKAFFITSLMVVLGCQFLFARQGEDKKDFKNDFNWKEISTLPPGYNQDAQKGVASPFAGSIDEKIFVLGGCNFSETASDLI